MWRTLIVFLLLLLVLGCQRFEVSADEWKRMSSTDRELVVQSLIGGQQAAGAKGGAGVAANQRPAYYVSEIDRKIARGDQRAIQEIWAEMLKMGK